MSVVPPSPGRVLIVKPGSLGDIVHALPAVAWLKATWPDVEISWLVDSRWRSLLENYPGIDRLVEFPRTRFRGPAGWCGFVAWLRGLRDLQPGLAIDLQGLLRSAIMGKAAAPGRLLGGSDAREGAGWFYQTVAEVDRQAHAVERYRKIVAAAGVNTRTEPEIDFPATALPDGFDPSEPFLLLHPFSRGKGKSLASGQVTELVRLLTPIRVVLVGQLPSEMTPPVGGENWFNRTTLPELLALCRAAACVISVDSGPAHLAAAVSERLLALHTWTDPARVGPWGGMAEVWRGGQICRCQPGATYAEGRMVQDSDLPTLVNWVRPKMKG